MSAAPAFQIPIRLTTTDSDQQHQAAKDNAIEANTYIVKSVIFATKISIISEQHMSAAPAFQSPIRLMTTDSD